MSEAENNENTGFEVETMDEEALAEAARPKSFNDGITVKGRVKRATRLDKVATGGELAGSPQINLLIEVFADADDADSAMDDPGVWHRLALPLSTEKGKRLSNKALGIANAQLHALNPDEVPFAKRGATIDETMIAFKKSQAYALEVWKDPSKLVGKVFTFDIAVTEGEKGTFVNARRLRPGLFDDETYTDADSIVG